MVIITAVIPTIIIVSVIIAYFNNICKLLKCDKQTIIVDK